MADDVLEKIKRAYEHLVEFQSTLDAFRQSKPYEVTGKRDPKTRQFIYSIVKADPIPVRLSVISGDVLQNLRSSLDYLACSLVRSHSPSAPIDKCGFPIFDEVPTTKEHERTFARKVKGMEDKAIDLIKNIKPYKGGDDVLWRLHALNNRDKHRLLLTTATGLRPLNVGMHMRATRQNMRGHVPDFYVSTGSRVFPLKIGTVLYVDSPDAEENKNIEITVDVVFNEPGVCVGEPVFLVLRRSLNEVRRTVEKFATFR